MINWRDTSFLILGMFVGMIVLLWVLAALVSARDASQVRLFRKTYPCPSTQKYTGACPDYVIDHKIPLCAGGPDTVENMAWQEKRQSYIKDKWERQYCASLKKEIRK